MRRPNLLAGKAPADGRWLKEPAGKAFSGAPENGGLAGKELWLCVAQVCLPARNFGYASTKFACRQGTSGCAVTQGACRQGTRREHKEGNC